MFRASCLSFPTKMHVVYHCYYCFFASQDGSCNGNAHLDLFHYPFYSVILITRLDLQGPDRGCKMRWVVFNLHWGWICLDGMHNVASPEVLRCHIYYCPAEGRGEESTGMAHKAEHAD